MKEKFLTEAEKQEIKRLKKLSRKLTRQGKVAEATKLFNRAWELENPDLVRLNWRLNEYSG